MFSSAWRAGGQVKILTTAPAAPFPNPSASASRAQPTYPGSMPLSGAFCTWAASRTFNYEILMIPASPKPADAVEQLMQEAQYLARHVEGGLFRLNDDGVDTVKLFQPPVRSE
jgi:hypothetical protein